MYIIPDGVKVIQDLSDSVSKLTDDIIKRKEWIMENDPDPERTANYMIVKAVRDWFNKRGNLPY